MDVRVEKKGVSDEDEDDSDGTMTMTPVMKGRSLISPKMNYEYSYVS